MSTEPLSTQPPVQASKAAWRRWAKARRAALLRLGLLNAEAQQAHLHAFLRSRGARVVLAYHALPGEPDVGALAEHFRLLTPRAHFAAAHAPPALTLHEWRSATERSRFGALEPPLGTPEVPLSEVDAALLPGLAFDTFGARLGYGGGFYDRLLPGFDGLSVGLVHSALLVAELPTEAHDCRAQWLATERGVQRSR